MEGVAGAITTAVLASGGSEKYADINRHLHALHAEMAARRRAGGEPQTATAVGAPVPEEPGSEAIGMTNFSTRDVCLCSAHGAHATCLTCSLHKNSVAQTEFSRYFTYCRIFQDVPALQEMRPNSTESMAVGYAHRNLVAGEIHFPSFINMVQHALAGHSTGHRGQVGLHGGSFGEPGCKVHFLDLGSGLGRAVIAFALCYSPWESEAENEQNDIIAVGVEIRQKVHKVVYDVVLPALPSNLRRRVSLVCKDMFDVPCNDADLVLVNATGLEDVVFQKLKGKLEAELHSGARVISLSLPLQSAFFEELEASQRQFRMSWGNCTVFFYCRR